ncbi:MAG: hypothetical protein Q7K34_01345 [archaeon]|nr:hypothetical protein [archaeon]
MDGIFKSANHYYVVFSSKVFWLISLALLSVSILIEFTLRRFLSFGFIGDLLLYAGVVSFFGFLLRKKWGWTVTMLVQMGYLATFLFPSILVFEFVTQFVGIVIIYLSRPEFLNRN